MELVVVPDTDVEAIALKAWSDWYWRKSDQIEVARATLSVSTASPIVGKMTRLDTN
jgi:hypothetical protein